MDVSPIYTIAMFSLGFSLAAVAGVFVLFTRLHGKGMLDKGEPQKRPKPHGSLFRF